MAAPVTPCEPWTSEDELGRLCGDLCNGTTGGVDQDKLLDAIHWASAVLYRLDGQRLRGLCTATVTACYDSFTCTSCHQESTGWEVTGPLGPVAWSGWYSQHQRLDPSAGAGGGCGCSTRCDDHLLLLPFGPLQSLVRVRVNGVDVTTEGFTIVDQRYLRRTSGECWPARADVEVTVVWGRPIPRDARSAAGELACEWLRAHTPSANCALPAGLTSLSREELSLTVAPTILDGADVHQALSGLPWVYRWLQSRRAPRRGARVLTTAAPPRWRMER